jgi:ubiquinone/menaquinone biosynthesis C-methylase UbiE
LADNTVDTVVSLAVIEHLNDYKKFTEEIYRILKKDGQAVITTPKALIEPIIQTMWRIGLLEKEEVQDHKRYFTKTQLEELFHGAGFRQVSVTSFELGLNQLVIVTK